MRQLLTLAIAISTVSALAFSALSLRTANALQEGDSVTFLIREDQIQPQPPSGPHDGLLFTGGPSSTIDVTGFCGTGIRPVQQAVLRDISGGKSGMVEDVVVVSESDPIPQGTELRTLTPNGSCTLSDGLTYNRYLGTVTRTQ